MKESSCWFDLFCTVNTCATLRDPNKPKPRLIRRNCARVKRRDQRPNQDEDIWNISSRVNQQGRGPISTQPDWPTHDHHLSLESFVLPPEKDNRPAPPPYSELDLPSYEQATGCRPPKPDLTIVHSTPRHERDLERNIAGPSS